MSSDGLRHEGEMAAPDKDSVYDALRKQGIRAIKVTERIRPVVRNGFAGLRKRDWSLIGVVVCAAVAIVAFVILRQRPVVTSTMPVVGGDQTVVISSGVVQIAQPRPRKWIRLPEGFKPSKVFRYSHEVYLAKFAIPGVASGDAKLTPAISQDFYDHLNSGIIIAEGDSSEVADLKRIVAGMKDDARKYLTMPNGIEKLSLWLQERQAMESGYRQQFAERVKDGKLSKDDANDVFRAMGLEVIQ